MSSLHCYHQRNKSWIRRLQVLLFPVFQIESCFESMRGVFSNERSNRDGHSFVGKEKDNASSENVRFQSKRMIRFCYR